MTQATDLLRRYATDLHRYLRRFLRHPQNADDVAQEVFIRFLRVQDQDVIKKPKAYLYGIAFHVLREFKLRENQGFLSYDSAAVERIDEHPSHVVPDELSERVNLQQQIEKALNDLPAAQRAVLLACRRDGMTYGEAAKATGISIHMVEKHLIQARAKIAKVILDL